MTAVCQWHPPSHLKVNDNIHTNRLVLAAFLTSGHQPDCASFDVRRFAVGLGRSRRRATTPGRASFSCCDCEALVVLTV